MSAAQWVIVGACLVWIGVSGAAWIIARRVKRARLMREAEESLSED